MNRPPNRMKVADNLAGMLTHPEWRYSSAANQTAYQLAHKTDLPMFQHIYRIPAIAPLFQNSVKVSRHEFYHYTPSLPSLASLPSFFVTVYRRCSG
jgi:hypothetical protein